MARKNIISEQEDFADKQKGNKRLLTLLLIFLGFLIIAFGVFQYIYVNYLAPSFGVISEEVLVQVPEDEIPKDTLYISATRREYQRGKMTLVIPAIGLYTPIGESTTPAGLKDMPGLYEFSQLPGEGDLNVSIAGHRSIKEFYYIDGLKDKDYIYLLYNNIIYKYVYKETLFVEPNDWSVIKPQGFSAITLTTCDPPKNVTHRLIVRGELKEYTDYEEAYQFLSNENLEP